MESTAEQVPVETEKATPEVTEKVDQIPEVKEDNSSTPKIQEETKDGKEDKNEDFMYENKEAYDPVEAMKHLSLQDSKPLSIVEIEQKISANEAVPGVYKINDGAEKVEVKSESKQTAIVRPWMKKKDTPPASASEEKKEMPQKE
ncbi:unnamed protein product [Moneuplotes crassus]|uniref:Uncharacterized protein n=1 Tax=Euplotes crassus TaxID=5936 RepID=A0AAD1XZ87_EUPCR|nr:unnamed protein product [Moneuplotes crassus]